MEIGRLTQAKTMTQNTLLAVCRFACHTHVTSTDKKLKRLASGAEIISECTNTTRPSKNKQTNKIRNQNVNQRAIQSPYYGSNSALQLKEEAMEEVDLVILLIDGPPVSCSYLFRHSTV